MEQLLLSFIQDGLILLNNRISDSLQTVNYKYVPEKYVGFGS